MHFEILFCPMYIMLNTEEWCINVITDWWFKNYIRNLVSFHGSSRKSKNLHFDKLFLLIAYKVSPKKVQKSYLSRHWRVIQTLKKNWLWKMVQGIQWILTRTPLMGYFYWKYEMFELKKHKSAVWWNMNYRFKNYIRIFHTSSWK